MKDYKTNSQKSLSSNQICTNLNCMFFLTALAHMNLKSSIHVFLGAQTHSCIWNKWRSGQSCHTWPKLSMAQTHMHTLVLEILQYRGQGKQSTSLPQIHSHILQQVFKLPMFLNACLSVTITIQRHVVSAFPQEEWSNRESINSLMLSHKFTCAHMIFKFIDRPVSAHAHSQSDHL